MGLKRQETDENRNIAGKLYEKKIYNVCVQNYTSQKRNIQSSLTKCFGFHLTRNILGRKTLNST